MKTIPVQGAPVHGVSASVGETIKHTAKSIKSTLGHTFSKVGHTIKDISVKIGRAVADSFKNFPKFIRSGYGVGAVGLVAGGGFLITAIALKGEKQQAARAGLIVLSCAAFFASAAFMFAFGKNPVAFGRAPAQLGW